MTIDTEKAMIWGNDGGSGYYINDSGGLELTDQVGGGLTDAEFTAAIKEIMTDSKKGKNDVLHRKI